MSDDSQLNRSGVFFSIPLLFKWKKRKFRRYLPLYLLLIPTMTFIAVFSYFPALSAFYHSTFNWHPGFQSNFTGLSNFVQAFQDNDFLSGFRRVMWLVLFGVTIAFATPFLVAQMLLAVRNQRIQSILKALLIIPLAFPGVVTILLWGFMFDPTQGLINTTLHSLGVHGTINWLGSPRLALFSIMLIGFPWVAGLPFLVYLAGLQSIPPELHEAARIDGANAFHRILRIDVPLVMSQTRLLTILAVVNWMQNIVPMMLLTNGGPSYATMVPVLWAFNQAFTVGQWGYACALSVILFIIMLTVSLISSRLIKGTDAIQQ